MADFAEMKKYAQEDADVIFQRIQKYYPDAKLDKLEFTENPEKPEIPMKRYEGKDIDILEAKITIVNGEKTAIGTMQYFSYPDDAENNIYISKSQYYVGGMMLRQLESDVSSSTKVTASKTPIKAAEGDEEFADFEGREEDVFEDDPDNFEDSLDDLADSVDDLQDSVEDMEEDEPNIEVDNNIDGHYIAECETCHGVFISALVESDQEVEKLSGVCPLCGKHTDQYIKWIVKSV